MAYRLHANMDDSDPDDSRPPQDTNRDQAFLNTMPLEIFREITGYLELEDVLSLRQVSKATDYLCIPQFVETWTKRMTWDPTEVWGEESFILWRNMHKPENIEVVCTPKGLEAMRRLPRILEITAGVRTLVLHIYAKADNDGLEHWRNLVGEEYDSLGAPRIETLSQLRNYQNQIVSQDRELAAIESHSEVECFLEAFKTLENLEEVHINDLRVHSAISFHCQIWRYYSAASISREISRISSAVLTAMAQSSNKISTIKFGDLQMWKAYKWSCERIFRWDTNQQLMIWPEVFSACHVSAFDIPQALLSGVFSNPAAFSSLRSLQATLSGADNDSTDASQIRYLQGFTALLRACPNLKKLELDVLKRTYCLAGSNHSQHEIRECGSLHPMTAFIGPSALPQLLKALRYGQLEHLDLADFVAHPNDFRDLLDSQKTSLRVLKVTTGHLIEGEWAHCYRQLLDGFVLEELHLGDLFQLDRDGYKRSMLCDPQEGSGWLKMYTQGCWSVPENRIGTDGTCDLDPQEALRFLLNHEKFDVGYYPLLADLLNKNAHGFPMYATDPNNISALIRRFAEDYFDIDTTYDLSWLFGREVLAYVRDWKEDPEYKDTWWRSW